MFNSFRSTLLFVLLMPLACFGGASPSVPAPAPSPPQEQDAGVTASRDQERARRRAAAGNTILTSPLGVTGVAPVQAKTLFGN
jgi:hypothetical protein